MLWFTKSRRAQSDTDYETWIEGGVCPTLNIFDNGTETRATVLIIDGTRVGDVRVYEDDVMQTVIQRWGTGGGNVPYVYPIQGTVIGRSDTAGPHGKGFGEDGDPMYTIETVGGHGVATYPIQDGREVEKKQNGLGVGNDGDPSYTLDTASATAIAFDTQFGSNATTFEDLSPTLKASQQSPSFAAQSVVRRLTPTECERLQGFPDGWTEQRYDYKKQTVVDQADSSRYKQMGNAVAVPCVDWIIARLVQADVDDRQA